MEQVKTAPIPFSRQVFLPVPLHHPSQQPRRGRKLAVDRNQSARQPWQFSRNQGGGKIAWVSFRLGKPNIANRNQSYDSMTISVNIPNQAK